MDGSTATSTSAFGTAEGSAITPPFTLSPAGRRVFVEATDQALERLDADVGDVLFVIEKLTKRIRKLERRHRELAEEVEGQRVLLDLLWSMQRRGAG
ncbi:MAG: hypothetical protein PVG27_09270 [Chloroflexota bacterium]|jgi:hypothetical protein